MDRKQAMGPKNRPMNSANDTAHGTNSRSRQFKNQDQSGPSTVQGQREDFGGYYHQPHQDRSRQQNNRPFNKNRTKEQSRRWCEVTPTVQNRPAKEKALEQEVEALKMRLEETVRERDHQTARADDLQKQLEGKAREDKTLQKPPPNTNTSEREAFSRALEKSGLKEDFEKEKKSSRPDEMPPQTAEELLADTQKLCLELYSEVKRLEEELEDSTCQRQRLAKEFNLENHALIRKVKDLECAASRSASSSLRKEITALKKSNIDTASRLKTTQESNLELQKVLDASRTECGELVRKVNSLEEHLTEEVQKSQELTKNVTLENKKLILKIKNLEYEASSSALQNESLKSELKAAKQSNIDTASRLKTTQESNLELQTVLDASRTECGELVRKVSSLELFKEEVQKSQELTKNVALENQKLILKIKNLECEASSSALQNESLKSELKAAKQSNIDTASRLKTTQESNLELQKVLDDSREEFGELVRKVSSLEHETMEKICLTNELKAENNTLRLEVEAHKDEASNKEELFGRQIKELKEELEAQKSSSLLLTSKLTVQEVICKAVQETGKEEMAHLTSRAVDSQKKLQGITQLFHESEKVTLWRKAKKLVTPKCWRQFKLQTQLTQLEQQQ